MPSIDANWALNACSVSVLVSFGEFANFASMAFATCTARSGSETFETYHPICPCGVARSSAYFQWNIIDWLSIALLPAL